MMEMKRYKLSEIATVEISGVDKKRKENETPVKLCNFTDVYHNWAITKDLEDSFMDATASEKEIKTFSLKKGQVAFTKDSETRDDIGIPTYIADNFENVLLGYHTALITPDKTKLNGKYLNAFMNSRYIQKYFENNASGSGQRYTLSNDTLNSIPIIIPNLTKQKVVGNFFSNIDKKIALNKKINTKLEAMAKRLYDYWFVQFDYPDKNGKPYKTSGGKMVWNEVLKREIPEGWEVKRLGDVISTSCERINTNDIKNQYYVPIEVIPRNKMSFHETAALDKAATGLCSFKKRSILLSNRRVYFHKVCISPFDGITRDTVIIINPKQNDNLGFVYQIVNSNHFIDYATVHSYGSEQPVLSTPAVLNYRIIYPNCDLDMKYNQKIESFVSLVLQNEHEIQKLTELRDRLLPLLMNGQVVTD